MQRNILKKYINEPKGISPCHLLCKHLNSSNNVFLTQTNKARFISVIGIISKISDTLFLFSNVAHNICTYNMRIRKISIIYCY